MAYRRSHRETTDRGNDSCTIMQMIRNNAITGISLDPSETTMDRCDSCEYAKATRKPIGKVQDPPRREDSGDEVHSDLLRAKDEAFNAYKYYEAWANTQFDTKIKRLRSD
jgi:hypothetical protein